MQVTSVGHAGFRIDTKAGSILCDPWVNPAYFASWFPFPDNSGLDWAALGDVDYVYVSHLHKDHFDPQNLREHVNKDAVVLLPDFPVPDLRRELEGLGFSRFFETTDSVKHRVSGPKGDLDVMIIALRAPADAARPRGARAPARKSLTARVIEDLRAEILGGQLTPGDKLPTESALIDRFGVSRTVIREAVAELRADRLVESRHGVGVFVLDRPEPATAAIHLPPFSKISDMIEELELRAAVEIEAAGLAAQRASPAEGEGGPHAAQRALLGARLG